MELTDFGHAPRDHPLGYPGIVPADSYVFVRGDIERLDEADASNEVLMRHGGTPIDERVPVIAYGSNAAPSQLRHKYDGVPDAVIPVIAARMANVGIGFSRHVTRYGSIPATLIHSNGGDASLFVLFLDEQQLEILTATEGNYDRVELDGDRYPVVLASGERLETTCAFVSRRGVLGFDGRIAVAQSQAELWGELSSRWSTEPACTLPTVPDEIVAYLLAGPDEAARVHDAFLRHTHDLASSCELSVSPP